jgi:hypothetical protein
MVEAATSAEPRKAYNDWIKPVDRQIAFRLESSGLRPNLGLGQNGQSLVSWLSPANYYTRPKIHDS